MTGELTLHGQIKAVGGVKEKLIAGHRSGLKTIIIPKENESDIDDLPLAIQESLEIIPVSHLDDVLAIAYE